MAATPRKRTDSSTSPPGWCRPDEAAQYAGVKRKTMLRWMKQGLRHVSVNKKVKLTKFEYIDEYLNGFHPDNELSVADITEQAFQKVMGQN